MRDSPATLLVVSHDRRLLETVCDRLWVVGDGAAAAFDGGYRAWREAVAGGWTVAEVSPNGGSGIAPARSRAPLLQRLRAWQSLGSRRRGAATAAAGSPWRSQTARPDRPRHHGTTAQEALEKLSKDAYRRQKGVLDAELTRLGLRKSHLELAMGDPAVAANFVEMRRVTSELADVDRALAAAEDAWLAAGGAGAVTRRDRIAASASRVRSGAASRPSRAGSASDRASSSIDADQVARDVLAAGTPEVEAVYARFGEDLRAAGRRARPGGARADRLRGRRRAARPRGDRPSRRAAAHPRALDEAAGRARPPSSSRRSSSSRAGSRSCATRSGS